GYLRAESAAAPGGDRPGVGGSGGAPESQPDGHFGGIERQIDADADGRDPPDAAGVGDGCGGLLDGAQGERGAEAVGSADGGEGGECLSGGGAGFQGQ